jgi:hypothetical protein
MDISVLIPSRGRPKSLFRAVKSLGNHPNVEIMIGLDEDDPECGEAKELLGTEPVSVLVQERKMTHHMVLNNLYKRSTGNWVFGFTDDYVMEQPDWPALLLHSLQAMPKQLGVAYVRDAIYPSFCTLPVLSRKMIDMQGFFVPGWFPFMFGDTWWNEIGNLANIKVAMDCSAAIMADTGNDHRYKDIGLWATVFEKTRPWRAEVAIEVIRQVHDGDQPQIDHLIGTLPIRIAMCEQFQAEMFTPNFQNRLERKGEMPNPHYPAIREMAKAFLVKLEAAA